MKIKHPVKGYVDFEPYGYQKELIQKLVNENKNVIVFSSRQMGTSTTLFYCMRELCLRNPGYKALLVTSNGYAHDGLNRFPDIEFIKSRSKFRIEYENGSEILFLPGYSIAGENLNGYETFFDLYEFISKPLIGNLMQCFSENEFKPRFYSFTGNNDFKNEKFEILKWNWDLHPERDQKWYNEQEQNMGSVQQVKKELVVE